MLSSKEEQTQLLKTGEQKHEEVQRFFQDHALRQDQEIWILVFCTLVRIFNFSDNWIIITLVYKGLLKSRHFMANFIS